ncbi:hypothetical protein [Biformimicrobium ophioploci]|uniref:hypothetical protein n=1 Tax=Biformimicrobium ophioploci TaxID=3036711 RepID=UPI0025544B4E|nr:hypothetical protein [Microbulbifer sp. NKW57]
MASALCTRAASFIVAAFLMFAAGAAAVAQEAAVSDSASVTIRLVIERNVQLQQQESQQDAGARLQDAGSSGFCLSNPSGMPVTLSWVPALIEDGASVQAGSYAQVTQQSREGQEGCIAPELLGGTGGGPGLVELLVAPE